MIRITKYNDADKAHWDSFVSVSRNGTFLFQRGYMDYHRDRFADHSLLFYDEKDRLLALLPGNEADTVYHSHQGLTYGGFILPRKAHAATVEELFNVTASYLKERGFTVWNYKSVPHIYHTVASEEDEYFMWRMGAEQSVCNLSSTITIDGDNTLAIDERKQRMVRSLSRRGITLQIDAPLEDFWPILEANLLARHGVKPVHSLSEIQLLKSRFPKEIECCVVRDEQGNPLAGGVAYLMGHVVHIQYSSVSPIGQPLHAQEFLYLTMINHYKHLPGVRYIDFGISNEQRGMILNHTLTRFKESFGARGTTYRQWTIRLNGPTA